MDYTAVGDTTNLAARLQTASGPGEIMLSEEAHRRLAEWLAAHEMAAAREELQLKGFAQPVAAYRLPAPAVEPLPARRGG
jgi:class 3 adenylate cyclase